MTRRALVAGLLLSAATAQWAAAQPLEFKGFQLGGDPAELQRQFPELRCFADGCSFDIYSSLNPPCPILNPEPCRRELSAKYSFGPISGSRWQIGIEKGAVGLFSVPFVWTQYQQVVDTISAKYGDPTRQQVEAVQSATGATYDSRVATWVRNDGTLEVRERATDIRTGSVLMFTPWYFPAKQARHKAQAAKGAGNL